MMKYQLTDEQIDGLFTFCKKHYVRHYDVQVELVDHLANAIEEKIGANPKMSFEEALNATHKSFGYKGFAGVVEAKANAMERHHRRLKKKFFLEYFTWPKAAFTVMVIAFLWLLQNIFPADMLVWVITGLSISFFLFDIVMMVKLYRLFKGQKQKLMLTENRGGQLFPAFLGFQVMVQCMKFEKEHIAVWQYYLFAAIFIFMVISCLSYFNMCKKLKELSLKDYPKAFA